MSKRPHDPANAAALARLRDTFDTTQLLHLVDQWDAGCRELTDPDSLRADLLRLHTMAHAVINGGPLSVASSPFSVGELAVEVSMELDQLITVLADMRRRVQPLEALAPRID